MTTTLINTEALLQQVIGQTIQAWSAQSKAVTDFFGLYEDDYYFTEVATGKNRAIYLLGHLIASSDGMLPLFGLGDRMYPEYEKIFSLTPDRAVVQLPTLTELKKNWDEINQVLAQHFSEMEPSGWLDRHTKVTPEEFATQPERNKLNVLASRTNHISYHRGQLVFLKKK